MFRDGEDDFVKFNFPIGVLVKEVLKLMIVGILDSADELRSSLFIISY